MKASAYAVKLFCLTVYTDAFVQRILKGDNIMNHPYKKHDEMLGRDLSAAERLEPARAALRYAVRLLEQFERDTTKASDRLSENQLETICKAADMAWKAAENCAFLGTSGFNAHPLERIVWTDE